ncbi:hypothetical protein CXF68_17020 [Tenacibaculum sp. Bg11-29]|uniref:integrase core domain-containing protein n=1 Tax=Tenacibaculum sp. Bg11-29 TaxID=2058306 RepID=UPI000C3365B1|nr:integrase core domain-containing protein [Tenacibaculum sp. Bg11-29]PKH52290.1 hypothetical protein CXF68_17020 [Tenacibaculum sp. Bg11-29]
MIILKVGRDTLFKVLRKHKMLTLRRKNSARTTNSYHRFYKYKNIIKDLEVNRTNQVWVSDITYIRTVKGFCYLALITENAMAERVNGILKDKFYLDQTFENVAHAKRAAKSVINLYNEVRIHLSLGYKY